MKTQGFGIECPNCKTQQFISPHPIEISQDVHCKGCGLFLYREEVRGARYKFRKAKETEQVLSDIGDFAEQALEGIFANVANSVRNVLLSR